MKPGRQRNKKYATIVIRVRSNASDAGNIRKAARLLKSGEVVAFPTETVYGLGANALDSTSIHKIFKIKGRPRDNPLIVHIGYKKDLSRYTTGISPTVQKLIKEFWPGPLTLILPKKKNIPDSVTAGLRSVAIRMPDNPVALALIRRAGVPLAAPSANISGKPSPTRAEHVYSDLNGKIPLILDGGPTKIGLESTVLDCTGLPFVLLRPGKITRNAIERITGPVLMQGAENYGERIRVKSPGMNYRHYAPEAPIILVIGKPSSIRTKITEYVERYREGKKRVGILSFFQSPYYPESPDVIPVYLGHNNLRVSRKLFDTLRSFDALGVDIILSEQYPDALHAINNRLMKAASYIVNCS